MIYIVTVMPAAAVVIDMPVFCRTTLLQCSLNDSILLSVRRPSRSCTVSKLLNIRLTYYREMLTSFVATNRCTL